MMKEAINYTKLLDGKVLCTLCPHQCNIFIGKTGLCKRYKNEEGKLFSLSYGTAAVIGIDPMEKKPLYHYFPGEKILSVGLYGCNLSCVFCQNYDLSFGSGGVQSISPEQLVKMMADHALTHLAFTYNEPLINFEFVLDVFQFLKQNHLSTVLVTNGFIQEKPLLNLLPWVDALNIDLKGSRDFYKTLCKGQLEPVQRTIQLAFTKSHIEITYLMIPGYNDNNEDLLQCRDFLTGLSPSIPVHINRYFPAYRMTAPPTPVSSLVEARKLFLQTMWYVYLGNVDLPEVQNTYCHHCHSILIKRTNYELYYTNILNGKCLVCGEKLDMITRNMAC